MVITFTAVLLGLLVLIRPLQKNNFYILHSAIVILSAYLVETYWFRTTPFVYKTLLLLLVFHIISINITTFIAYYVDKRAAIKRAWRVKENSLHLLEFLGGWLGAFLAQRVLHHKTSKKNFQNIFVLMIFLEFLAVYIILKYLGIV